jgi:hypothetical protein
MLLLAEIKMAGPDEDMTDLLVAEDVIHIRSADIHDSILCEERIKIDY